MFLLPNALALGKESGTIKPQYVCVSSTEVVPPVNTMHDTSITMYDTLGHLLCGADCYCCVVNTVNSVISIHSLQYQKTYAKLFL